MKIKNSESKIEEKIRKKNERTQEDNCWHDIEKKSYKCQQK